MGTPYRPLSCAKSRNNVSTILTAFGVAVVFGCTTKPVLKIGDPLAGLTQAQLARFETGRVAFTRVFSPAEGLGPLLNTNGNSCAECHEDPVTGGSGDENEIHATRFTAPDGCDLLFHEGGPVIQQATTPLLKAKGVEKEAIPPSATSQAVRSSPPLFGFGLIDAIPDKTILALADPDDADKDGISGRVNRGIDGRVGKFGRKAAVATVFDFSAGAYPFEMGVTTPLTPVEETLNGKPVPPDTDPAPEPEIPLADIQQASDFIRLLAAPARHLPESKDDKLKVERGKQLFDDVKCVRCHVPELQTGPSDIAALDRKTVALYSDLLLHDMGPGLADICLGLATPSEFRTEMLMGLRFRERFLHDGSATTVQQAIERHDAEARKSRDAFNALNEYDKAALLLFLNTI